jgi:hypothetical protein
LLGFVIVAVTQTQSQNVTKDYCSDELCQPEKRPHIACRHDNQFVRTCPADRHQIPMSTKRKNLLLMLHNRMRNKVALGKLKGYKPAKRMPVLVKLKMGLISMSSLTPGSSPSTEMGRRVGLLGRVECENLQICARLMQEHE